MRRSGRWSRCSGGAAVFHLHVIYIERARGPKGGGCGTCTGVDDEDVPVFKVVNEGMEIVELQAAAGVVPALRYKVQRLHRRQCHGLTNLFVDLLDHLDGVMDHVPVALDGRGDPLELGVGRAVGASS